MKAHINTSVFRTRLRKVVAVKKVQVIVTVTLEKFGNFWYNLLNTKKQIG